MSHLAPYNNAMRIGQGFNTYTQDIRLEDAVRITKRALIASPHAPATATQSHAAPTPLPAGIPSKLAALRHASPGGNPTPPSTPQAAAAYASKRLSTISNIGNDMHASPSPVIQAGTPSNANAAAEPPAIEHLSDAELPRAVSPARSAASVLGPPLEGPAFTLSQPEAPPPLSQNVTFSTRAIENVSDIMDALNISAAMSIGYGTIHGNGSAGYVNESKILDAELNYIVSVCVNNDCDQTAPVDMEFQPIDDIPPDQFTQVYGDSFISGFEEGGVFNAIISIQVNDKRKLRQVKQAADLQLAVGPAPVTVGASESFDSSHAAALQDTEITISVNWSGGGEVKKPDVPWTMQSVVAVANAFPSMVARNASKTSAILTRYEALRSFQAWKWRMIAKDKEWGRRFVVLNYAPCALYTADLFDHMMAYKKLWKQIGEMLKNPTKYKAREPADGNSHRGLSRKGNWSDLRAQANVGSHNSPAIPPPRRAAPRALSRTPNSATSTRSRQSDFPQTSPAVRTRHFDNPQLSPCDKRFLGLNPRLNTFDIDDDMVEEDWDLDVANKNRDPIPVDPVALNEARLACREAMTLITEEAARLVDHPHLAYAEFNPVTGRTQMKRPNYAYPDVLRFRLPILVGNDASDDSWSQDPAALLTHSFSRDDDLYCHMVGDIANPHKSYKAFTSLTLNETSGGRTLKTQENELVKICLHSYHHHFLTPGHFSRDSDQAIGAIGFHFARDRAPDARGDDCPNHHYGHVSSDSESACKSLSLRSRSGFVDITRLDICYVPGTGRIAGLIFYDNFGEACTERLAMRQWGAAGHEPIGLEVVTQMPPDDGQRWGFVGVCGEFDASIWGGGTVLSRVSGIWRRV